MTKTALVSVLGGVAFVAFLGACVFVSAGRWDLPWFWAYLGRRAPVSYLLGVAFLVRLRPAASS
jgi:hypothetical protein